MDRVDGSEPRFVKDWARPRFPRRAVVTAGMPYGNKDLHFGHVGGVFVFADAYARFLRDRIGADNVAFVSGTDCYGSPIVADHADRVSRGVFSGSLEDFVRQNHERQAETLRSYSVALDCFAASALEPYREVHRRFGARIMQGLHRHGSLERRTTPQFFDPTVGTFLNGRQVLGRCPIQGCKSEKAYADECSLGHQYEPKDLVNPVSTLTGAVPEMRDVTNWYVPLDKFKDALLPWLNERLAKGDWREYSVRVVLEYFEPPTIHVNREQIEGEEELLRSLPPHRREAGTEKSDKLIFNSLADQDAAKALLGRQRVRFRTGKTLVPFRMTGNLEWGLPAPEIDGLAGLTFWVWPESLWAPISFTASLLERRAGREGREGQGRTSGTDAVGTDGTDGTGEDWKKWWCSRDAEVHQFIGEDNLFFYGLAEMAMFLGAEGHVESADVPEGELQLPLIVANRHILFLDKKASSSGAVKPPMARDLLQFYTSDQLRIHFLSLGLGNRNVSFRPKPLDPGATTGGSDPVLKDGNVLSNSLNRSVRSCFYTAQKYFDRALPAGEVSPDVLEQSERVILAFEREMARHEFHVAVEAAAKYVNEINKRWSQHQPFKEECDEQVRRQAVIDAFHMVRVATVLMHPVAPVGTEKVREQLGVGPEFWDWSRIFQRLPSFMADPAAHRFPELPPRADFFEKPAAQVAEGRD